MDTDYRIGYAVLGCAESQSGIANLVSPDYYFMSSGPEENRQTFLIEEVAL